jgi:hypothetical protein
MANIGLTVEFMLANDGLFHLVWDKLSQILRVLKTRQKTSRMLWQVIEQETTTSFLEN